MLNRRELLTRGTTLLVLVPVLPVLGCSSDGGDDGGGGNGACAGVRSTSSFDSQHTHTMCVLTADLTTPPSAGVNYTTSVDSSHSHKISLGQSDLAAINAGQTVMVTSSYDVDPINGESHMHTFAIKKA